MKSIGLFCAGLLAFFYGGLLLVAPQALQTNFVTAHALTWAQFSQIKEGHFFGYLMGLLLCGVIVDWLGANVALLVGMALLFLSQILLTHFHGFYPLLQARTVMGFGYGLISIALFKQVDQTFSAHRFPFGVAWIATVSVGVMLGTQWLLVSLGPNLSWPMYMNLFLWVGGGLLLLMLLLLPWWGLQRPSKILSLQEIAAVLTLPSFWIGSLAIYLASQYVFFLLNHVMGSFLWKTYHFSTIQIQVIIVSSLVLFSIASLIVGYFAHRLRHLRFVMFLGFALMVGTSFSLIDPTHTSKWLLVLTLAMGAIGASVIVLMYGRLRQYCSMATIGVTFGLTLSVYLIMQMLLQPYLYGNLLKLEKAPIFVSQHALQYGDLLGFVTMLILVGAFLSFGLRSPKQSLETAATLGQELKQCWHGEGPLGRTFWLVGVVGNIYVALASLTVIMMLHTPWLLMKTSQAWIPLLLIPFAVFSGLCIWRCAFNTSHSRSLGYWARGCVIVGWLWLLLLISLSLINLR